jgi:hypothetical protein
VQHPRRSHLHARRRDNLRYHVCALVRSTEMQKILDKKPFLQKSTIMPWR